MNYKSIAGWRFVAQNVSCGARYLGTSLFPVQIRTVHVCADIVCDLDPIREPRVCNTFAADVDRNNDKFRVTREVGSFVFHNRQYYLYYWFL